ncbi:MAG: phosphoribosylformylglycinamidine synthase subunit PurQ, partial [Opitutaceae bacterium]
KRITAPTSLIISAFAAVTDVRATLTPQLKFDFPSGTGVPPVGLENAEHGRDAHATLNQTVLLLIDLGRGKNRLGASILAQVVSQIGEETPDVDNPTDLKNFWNAIQQLGREKKLLAYHDRSDGGLLVTAIEMAFAGHTGLDLEIPAGHNAFSSLFSEELGAVIQIRETDLDEVYLTLRQHGFMTCTTRIAALNREHKFRVKRSGQILLDEDLFALRAIWSDVTRRIAALRDNPACAASEFKLKLDRANPGITPKLTFDLSQSFATEITEPGTESTESTPRSSVASSPSSVTSDRASVPSVAKIGIPKFSTRPPIAILREQGVNGQIEMAAAFTRAGFTAIDVHMTDILSGRVSLKDFRGLAACGGFSYGDVLGAGEGWAKSILFNPRARAEFAAFFAREDAFALGVCNGCQMMSNLHSIIPGSDHWPRFVQNQSERYEARFVSLQIEKTPSVLFAGIEGSVIPIAVAHGEGFTEFKNAAALAACNESGLVAGRFVDNAHRITEQYPLNPNGSPLGITALTTTTGRVTIMMPHPERVFRTAAMSWHPETWGEDSPWMKLFYNARAWVG